MSSSCRRIIDLSRPRRRWVAATVTIVMPAAGTEVPPGTVTRKENAPEVPTHWSPSQIPRERSYSVSAFIISRSSDDSGTPPNARSRLSYHVSHSGCRSTRKSVVIRHAYQGNAVRAREFPPSPEVPFTVMLSARTGDKWDLPCQAPGPMDRVPN